MKSNLSVIESGDVDCIETVEHFVQLSTEYGRANCGPPAVILELTPESRPDWKSRATESPILWRGFGDAADIAAIVSDEPQPAR
ncbi:MAG TPA: hypothetical protein VJS12_14315 [Steroidobacteraceae bacterium]|nr:hypothetical protein [Steroidobacteraceae bacterium]